MNKLKNKSKVLFKLLAVAIAYIGIYFLISEALIPFSWQSLILKMCYNIVLATSLSLVVGYLGELSLGHAAFYAVGAYVGGLVAIHIDLAVPGKFLFGILAGGAAAALVGYLSGFAIFRLKGDYLAIVTLAFGEAIRSFVKIIPGFGGTKGLQAVPSFPKGTMFLFSFPLVVITYVLLSNFIHSRQGRAIMAVRDNLVAASSVGINVKKYKMVAFTMAALFAGVAGVLFGFFKTTVEPGDFTYNVSIEILVMVVLGGMSLFGSAIAACILTALPQLLRDADKYRLLIYSLSLIFMMLAKSNPKFMQMVRRFSLKQFIKKIKGENGKEKGEVQN